MPATKRQKTRELENAKRRNSLVLAEIGDLVAYSRNGEPFKLGLVDSEDHGFVTSVLHSDGTVQGIRDSVVRYVARASILEATPGHVLEQVGGSITGEYEEIKEILRPFAKVSDKGGR